MRLFSSQSWVMPNFVPSRPLTARSVLVAVIVDHPSELDLDVDTRRLGETPSSLRTGVFLCRACSVHAGPELSVVCCLLPAREPARPARSDPRGRACRPNSAYHPRHLRAEDVARPWTARPGNRAIKD